jgi:hypothetical protein
MLHFIELGLEWIFYCKTYNLFFKSISTTPKIYYELAVLSIGVAVFFILLLPLFKKLMQGVH